MLGAGAGVTVGTALLLRSRLGNHRTAPPVDWKAVPAGELAAPDLLVLTATVRALFDVKSTDHYANVFRWRAANQAGDRGVMQAYVVEMNRLTPNFAAADRKAQLAALEAGVFLSPRLEALLFYTNIVDLIFMTYSLTDAWIAQGYDAWPGTPRGFDSYMKPAPGDPVHKR